jgi:transposase
VVSIPFELPGFEIKRAFASDNQCVFTAKAVIPTAKCPNCNIVSSSVHSYYTRTPQDLPLTNKAVRLILKVRRFRCLNLDCPKQTFAEPLPQVVAKNAQRTQRLTETLQLFAANLSAKLGSRLLKKLKIAVSPITLVRLLKQKAVLTIPKVRVLGVDDFAFKRGRSYGTILVDLETHTPLDLLPDRNANTLITWLSQHPEIEIVSRDRSTEYARGASEGAPQAQQVADRWHILVCRIDACWIPFGERRG